MKYHLNCLRKETRHTQKEDNTVGGDERDYIAGAICDIEIVNMVCVLSNDGVDMNSVHDSYISLRNEHGVHTIPGRNYKPDVKNILLYVADMVEMQTADPDAWTFLDEGNFVISKHGVPFTAINPDQSNRNIEI